MHCIYFVLVLCILTPRCFAQQSCENVNDELVKKVTDLENADFIFAGLFPIRNQGCKGYHAEKGVERMEAMIRAIQLINEDDSILSGIKIGYDMRDTCSQETIGIEETISLIQSEFNTGNMSGIPIGVIGAASSSVSVPIASFLRVFNIPQISYASTSALLSDTNRYDYFFRTVAPDKFQASAMLDIVNTYGWRFVNTLYTQSTYGTPGAEAFAQAVEANNQTCLDVESAIPTDEETLGILANRIANSHANVVVCFCTSVDANNIITAVRDYIRDNMPNRTHIVWIASDAWATSTAAASGVEEFVDGFFGVAPFSKEYTEYTDYFTSISPYNITNDLWFCGYFRQVYNCTYNTTNSNKMMCPNSVADAAIINDKPYQQNTKVPFIYDATYAMANALDSVLKEKCAIPYDISDNMCKNRNGGYTEVGGETLRDALYKVNFTGTIRDFVYFDSSGDGQAKYSIYTYNYRSDVKFQQVGLWDESMKRNELNLSGYNPIDNVTSYCGGIAPCDPGYKTNYQVGSSQCCWTCDPCRGETYSVGSFSVSCDTCPIGEWGNNPLESSTSCVTIEPRFINYNVWWTWIFLVISIGGLIGWLVVSIIYLGNWTHKVVRYSGREHCVLMLIGAGLSFLLAFFTIAKPLIVTCVIWSLLYWLSLSLLIFPLLMKIIRIVRIFISKQNIHTKRFISWHWQIVFSLIPVGIVLLIVTVSFSTKPDIIEILQFDNALATPTYQLQCDDGHDAFIITLYSIFILSVVVLLFFAVLTRTYLNNYRESVHIMYSSFSLIVVMFVNVIVFFVLPSEFAVYRRLVQNICLMLIAVTILLAFFGPRLYLLLFRRDAKDDEMNAHTNVTEAEGRENELRNTLGKNHPDVLDLLAKGHIQDNSLEKELCQKSGEGEEDKCGNSVRKEPL